MEKIRIHSIGLGSTIPNYDFESCAFTNKVRQFPSTLKNKGYHIIEYSNGESMSEADEKVQILTVQELSDLEGDNFSLKRMNYTRESPSYPLFVARLKREIATRIRPGDVVIHHYGSVYSFLLNDYPNNTHIELGIGYGEAGFGAFRVFDSNAWMHYHLGREEVHFPGRYMFVGGNSIDINRWRPIYEKKGGYLLFVGRVVSAKGLYVLKEMAKRLDEEIIVAGLGDFSEFEGENLKFIGEVTGEKKVELFRNARALIVPSEYTEPFGIVNIEALSVGTPLITSDYGAFPEIVEQGVNGFRCRTLADFIEATKHVEKLDRAHIAKSAAAKYSHEALGERYDEIIRQVHDLYNEGWYSPRSHLHVFNKFRD